MKSFFLSCLLFTSLFATELDPWFSPLWEFQSRTGIVYLNAHQVQSPSGSFSYRGNYTSLHLSMQITPWPYWNGEVELYLTHTHQRCFSYEAALVTVRYLLLDRNDCDFLNLSAGITASFPGSHFLRHFSFPYHGEANGEFHLSAGRGWLNRFWVYGGFGTANRGAPWIHLLLTWERELNSCTEIGLFAEGLFGLGSRNIIEEESFHGYSNVRHRNIDIGGYFLRQLGVLGMIRFDGWYSPYAHNFIEHAWGFSTTLLVPFSL